MPSLVILELCVASNRKSWLLQNVTAFGFHLYLAGKLGADCLFSQQGTEQAPSDLCKVPPSLRHKQAYTHLLRMLGYSFLQPGLHSQGECGLIIDV